MTHRRTITVAFAGDRDADHAASLIALSLDTLVTYTKHRSLDAQGGVAMVVIEATLADELEVMRAETLMAGAHGVRIPALA